MPTAIQIISVLIAGTILLGAILMVIAVRCAPIGYETDEGFHQHAEPIFDDAGGATSYARHLLASPSRATSSEELMRN